MSAIISNIVTAGKAQIATTLGATWRELPFVHQVEKNNERTGKLGYGFRALEANSSDGVNRVYTMDHKFEVVLTDTIARGTDDSQIESSIGTLFNKADEIFKAFVNTKLGVSTVLNIFGPTLSQPELLEKEKIIVLRLGFTVKYRSSLT